MKILIWLLCAFVPSAIQTVCKQGGYPLGAVEALILYGPAYWAAFKLCKIYDERKAAKVAAAVAESPAPEELPAPQPEQEPTIADPAAPATATPKLRFCKLCGAPIDPTTRKCTDCRKQYFRPPVLRKKHLAIAAGVLVCAAVVFLVFNLVSSLAAQKDAAQAQVDALNARITELEATIAEQDRKIGVYKKNEVSYRTQLATKEDTIKTLQETAQKLIPENYFYSQHIVLIGEGSKYHKYDCPYLDMSDGFLAYNSENAEYQGYKACSHCCG